MAPLFLRRPDADTAFERLYERHVRDVYRYAIAMLGEAADAEDVTQTTFLNAYRAFQSGTRPEKPQSWLMTIAHNVCRQRFRQAQRRPHEVAYDDGIGERDGPPEPTGPSAEDLRRALSQLPPNQRAAIVMRELEGGSYAEIAKVLGISVSALETLLFRARRALREQLDEQLTCQEAAFAVNKQIDGRLSLGEKRALRAHLRGCPECNSLAQSQRAQRRALKALVLIPLPATMSHWMGGQSAAAATGAGAAGAGGLAAVGVTGGGVAAKVAAVVAAGIVVGGGTYEGVTRVVLPPSHTAAPPAAARAQAVAPPLSSAPLASASTFETPKSSAPVQAQTKTHMRGFARSRAVHAAKAKRVLKAKRVARGRAAVVPPGQIVKAQLVKKHTATPKVLRTAPPGQDVAATRAVKTIPATAQKAAAQTRRPVRPHPTTPVPHVKANPASTKHLLVPRERNVAP